MDSYINLLMNRKIIGNILLLVCIVQGASGNFKDRKAIGELSYSELWMIEQIY